MPEPDLMAEASVLAGIVRYGSEAYLDASMVLRSESFTLLENQCLWKCLDYLLKNKGQFSAVDRPTLFSAASSCGLSDYFSQPDTRTHIESIYRIPIEQESVGRLSTKLRILDVTRDLSDRLQQARNQLDAVSGDESIDEILGIAESPSHAMIDELSGCMKPTRARQFGEGARERFRELVKNPRHIVGIPTGFKNFDKAIGGGLRPGAIDMICSRMKIGKSSLANNIAINIAGGLGIPVLNIDTEMTLEEQQDRAAASLTGLYLDDVERGTLTKEQQVKLGEGLKKLENIPYFHEEVQDLGFDDILGRIRRWVVRHVGFRDDGLANPCVVIFDYFQLMTANDIGRLAEHQALAFYAKKLKDMLKKLGVPCLSFAQQNRDGLDFKDERVLRGADRILDKVTSFWIFCRKGDDEVMPGKPGEPRLTHELHYMFSRFGKGLARENYINVATDYSRGYMSEGPTRDELFQQQGGVLKGVASGRVLEQKQTAAPGGSGTGEADAAD